MSGEHYDYLVVGAGLFGAVCTRQALDAGKTVLVLEKRPHVGGNVYTEWVEGICVHRYGPHIFHTNDETVWNYVNRYAEFVPYIHRPMASYQGKLYSLPFNMYTFQQFWGVSEPAQAEEILRRQCAEIQGTPRNLEEQAISQVGRDIYEALIRGYTEKQWGRSCRDLPPEIIRRLPVRMTFDDNYFNARYQGIPREGYTPLIERLLQGARVQLHTDYLTEKERWDALADRVIYTGCVDAYFHFSQGHLAYRSLRYEDEIRENSTVQQTRPVINYTEKGIPWTRTIEYRLFGNSTNNDNNITIISKEYPIEYNKNVEPYYPINDAANTALYHAYQEMEENEKKTVFGGRLGEYAYYDMDQVVTRALALSAEMKNRE